MKTVPLEDHHIDVIHKAIRGHGMSAQQLSELISQPLPDDMVVHDPELLQAIAAQLNLHAPSLLELASSPLAEDIPLPPSISRFTTAYGDMTVNAYLMHDTSSRHALIIDTGADATELLETIAREQLKISGILITHAHGDHIFELDRAMEKTKAPAYIHADEDPGGCRHLQHDQAINLPPFHILPLATRGHSAAGTSFLVASDDLSVVFVGDAIFARSIGGTASPQAYQTALDDARRNILTLPPQTLLLPGHGPATTVAIEQAHNPFLAVT